MEKESPYFLLGRKQKKEEKVRTFL